MSTCGSNRPRRTGSRNSRSCGGPDSQIGDRDVGIRGQMGDIADLGAELGTLDMGALVPVDAVEADRIVVCVPALVRIVPPEVELFDVAGAVDRDLILNQIAEYILIAPSAQRVEGQR